MTPKEINKHVYIGLGTLAVLLQITVWLLP